MGGGRDSSSIIQVPLPSFWCQWLGIGCLQSYFEATPTPVGPFNQATATARPRAQITPTPSPEPTDDEWVFVGYHGTSSIYGPDLIGIGTVTLPKKQNYIGGQLGLGFYTSTSFAAATFFANNATLSSGGAPIVLRVYARRTALSPPVVVPQSA